MTDTHSTPAPGAGRGIGRAPALFVAAVTVIALHVADDSFLQPNPGTSAGDHVAGGLVPLFLLAIAAALAVREGPGWLAAVALPVGLFGVAAGIEGWHYALAVGPSGDDYTGLLALPAGLLALGIGVVVLWRSRRRDGPRLRRYGRRAAIGVGTLAVTALVLVPVTLGYVFTHVGRAKVPEPNLGVPYEEVSFRTSDGLELEGWYVPSRNGAAVIAFPGRKGPQSRARFLARHGYGVLLFDRRGEGESDGDPNSFGWNGDRDAKAAIEFLRDRSDVDPERIGGIGLSVGGEMLLETAAETARLKAVVSEGAGQRSYREARHVSGIGVAGFLPMTAAVSVFSDESPPPDLRDLVPRIAPRPVLLIHGRDSQNGEERRYNRVYDAAGGKAVARWEIAESGHTGGLDARPREYERRVVSFFDRALLDR